MGADIAPRDLVAPSAGFSGAQKPGGSLEELHADCIVVDQGADDQMVPTAAAQGSRGSGGKKGPARKALRRQAEPCGLLGEPFADVRRDYAFGGDIGEGQSGRIRLCVQRATGRQFACKSVAKAPPAAAAGSAPAASAQLLQGEIAALEALSHHQNVVELVATYEDESDVHMIMEYCRGGDLFERVKQAKHFGEADAAELCAGLVGVVRSCHRRGIIHRDLKLENILLATPRSNTDIRVADFGVAAFLAPGHKLTAKNGTPLYMAPEVLNGSYGKECDIWSAGVILYILLCGVPPFWRPDNAGICAAIRSGRINTVSGPWQCVSRAAKDLVQQMLCVDPAKRITAREILDHPWILEHTGHRVPAPKAVPVWTYARVPAPKAVPEWTYANAPVDNAARAVAGGTAPKEACHAAAMELADCGVVPAPAGAVPADVAPAGVFCPAAVRSVKWRRSLEGAALEQVRVK